MNKTDTKRAQGYLDEIYEHWGPRLHLMNGGTIVMTGSDHGYTQWTIAPVEFIDDGQMKVYGVTEGQVATVVIDEADDRWVQIVAVGSGKVTTLQPLVINPNDPRAPSAADFEPVDKQAVEGELTIRRMKLRSDYR